MDTPEPKFRVSASGWKLIGSVAAIAGAICLVGLAAVLALGDDDALATIALVLAITAFIVQILVSVIQNAASRAAEADSRELNFETNKVLNEIKSSAAVNQNLLAEQFNTLLNALVAGRVGSPEDEGEGEKTRGEEPPEPERKPPAATPLGASLPRLQLPSNWQGLGSGTWQPLVSAQQQTPSAEDKRVIDRLKSWPNEEDGLELIDVLKSLSPQATWVLQRFGDDEIESRRKGRWVGYEPGGTVIAVAGDRELIQKGLLEEEVHEDTPILRLTDQGREVARLILAQGDPPPKLAEALGVTDADRRAADPPDVESDEEGGADEEGGRPT